MSTTKAQFSGTFYDGKSANKYPVTLFLTKLQLELVFSNGRRIAWNYPTLKLSRTGSKGPIRLERSSHPEVIPESVVIEDPDFLHAAHQVAPGALGTIWNQPHKRSLRYALMILALIALPPFIFAIWVYAIPGMTNAVADRIPTEWEEELGQSSVKTLFREPLEKPDPEMQKALDAISERLLASVPDQPYHFRIYVHPSKLVNALALPGGTIVVFQGLINITETPEELAGVLAHEFQHVLKRHSTRSIIRSEAINLFMMIISGNSDSMTNVIIQAGGVLEYLHHNRELETQADAEGMKMMLASQVDPRGMVRIFEKLEKQHFQLKPPKENRKQSDSEEKDFTENDSEKNDKVEKETEESTEEFKKWMKYLSTHPAGEDRVEVLKKLSQSSTRKPIPLLPDFDWKSMHREAKDTEFIF